MPQRHLGWLLGRAPLGQGQAGSVAGGGERAPVLALPWSGATWALDGNGYAYNTPTLGAGLLTDPGLETWTTATNLTSYTESIAGTSTVNREATIIHGGTYAARLDVDASASNVAIAQAVTVAVGQWLQFSAWLRSSVAAGKFGRLVPTNTILADNSIALTDVYTQYFATAFATTTAPALNVIRTVGNGSHSIYADDLSAKPLSLPALMASVDGGAAGLNASVGRRDFYVPSQMGVVSHLDSAVSPANFVLGIRHSTAARLYKCVAGVYTQLLSASTSGLDSPDARIEVRRLPGNVFQLWFNGQQSGADQVINDAGIINNTRYGLLSTLPLNTFARFQLGRSWVPFTF